MELTMNDSHESGNRISVGSGYMPNQFSDFPKQVLSFFNYADQTLRSAR